MNHSSSNPPSAPAVGAKESAMERVGEVWSYPQAKATSNAALAARVVELERDLASARQHAQEDDGPEFTVAEDCDLNALLNAVADYAKGNNQNMDTGLHMADLLDRVLLRLRPVATQQHTQAALSDVVKYTRLARGIQNPAGHYPDGPYEDFFACDDVLRAFADSEQPAAAPAAPAIRANAGPIPGDMPMDRFVASLPLPVYDYAAPAIQVQEGVTLDEIASALMFMDELPAAQAGEKWIQQFAKDADKVLYTPDIESQAPRIKWCAYFDSYDRLVAAYLLTRDVKNWTQLSKVRGQAFATRSTTATPAPVQPTSVEHAVAQDNDLAQRAIGRAEAARIIMDLNAEDGIDEFIGSHPSGDTGEWDAYWKDDKLRALLRVNDAAWSLAVEAENKLIDLQCRIAEKEMDKAFFGDATQPPDDVAPVQQAAQQGDGELPPGAVELTGEDLFVPLALDLRSAQGSEEIKQASQALLDWHNEQVRAAISQRAGSGEADSYPIKGLGRMTNEDGGYITLQFKDFDAACDFMNDYSPTVEVGEMPPIRPDVAQPESERDAALTELLSDLLSEYDRNICTHENRKRGGLIWTICKDCDKKWADDRGGFKPYSDPAKVAAARAAIAAQQGGQP